MAASMRALEARVSRERVERTVSFWYWGGNVSSTQAIPLAGPGKAVSRVSDRQGDLSRGWLWFAPSSSSSSEDDAMSSKLDNVCCDWSLNVTNCH